MLAEIGTAVFAAWTFSMTPMNPVPNPGTRIVMQVTTEARCNEVRGALMKEFGQSFRFSECRRATGKDAFERF